MRGGRGESGEGGEEEGEENICSAIHSCQGVHAAVWKMQDGRKMEYEMEFESWHDPACTYCT